MGTLNLILLAFIIVTLILVVLGVSVSQRVINILLLIIAAMVVLSTGGWKI